MPVDMNELIETLRKMKDTYENAILSGQYLNLIRSRKLIGMLHNFVIAELVKRKIPREWIYEDKPVYGYPKTKTQDVLIQPRQDEQSKITVGPIMSINIRSQLSSIEKNYDTLFERLFAEALNLHNKFPYLVLGYVYLLPKVGYDEEQAKNRKVALTERYDVEKYILSFLSISDRKGPEDLPWKYERTCLLIVDFEKNPPEVLDSMEALKREGLVSEEFANLFSFDTLSIRTFFDELYKIMKIRFYFLFEKR